MKGKILFFFILFLSVSTIYCQDSFYDELAEHAIELTNDKVIYDPVYYSIDYPGGDIPRGKGVCTDVIIRAYRKMNIDLQEEVHEDMKVNFDSYPKLWNLRATDTNIDHRRVPNLMKFFERNGEILPISQNPEDYSPGDIVCWDLGGGITHIGILIKRKSIDNTRFLVVHNIGQGQVIEDILFKYRIIGHYRYKKL